MPDITPLSLDDYEAIADAVQETERGRWFLREFALRNRAADTVAVLEALAGVERRLSMQQPGRATGFIEQALRSARLARAASATGSAPAFDELESNLTLALEALGGDASETEIADVDAAPEAGAAPPALPGPELDQEVTWVDLKRFEDQLNETAWEEPEPADVVTAPAAAEPESPRFSEQPTAEPAPSINGHATAPAIRPKLPSAYAPLLLDGLTEAERAILFA